MTTDTARVRLLVNGVSARAGGGRRFLVEQLRALDRLGEFEVYAFVPSETASELADLSPDTRILPVTPMRIIRRLLWEQTSLAWAARQVDVVYSPANFPLFLTRRPQVLCLQNPHHFGRQARLVRRTMFPPRARFRIRTEALIARWGIRRVDTVVSVSHALRAAAEEDLGALTNVEVIQSGTPALPFDATPGVTPSPSPWPAGYVLAVADDYPHKDWDGLIGLFLEHQQLPPLVLVGATRSQERGHDLALRTARSPSRVLLMGRITDRADLARLYDRASAFVAHSHLESFGFTPLEALARGIPVAATDLAPHREVCGARANYYPPRDLDAAARAIQAALAAPRTEPPADARGAFRSWDDNARALSATLLRAAGRRSSGARRGRVVAPRSARR